MNDIRVSIVCNTYNHGKYIRDALEGFVMQKTNFKYEVLVHDDASTDNTAEIIKEYEERYPDLIKPIYQKENQYSKGIKISYLQYERAKGDYIAFCEGDDYWISPDKLQKQFDALEAHPEINMCTHNAYHIRANTKKIETEQIVSNIPNDIISVEDIIVGDGGQYVTCSLFYRKKIVFEYPFLKNNHYDYALQIAGSLYNGAINLNETMSVYRTFTDGSWTQRMLENPENYKQFRYKEITMLNELNAFTGFRYDEIIREMILRKELLILKIDYKFKEMFDDKYIDIMKNMPLKQRIKNRLYCYFPFISKYGRYHVLRKKSDRG